MYFTPAVLMSNVGARVTGQSSDLTPDYHTDSVYFMIHKADE